MPDFRSPSFSMALLCATALLGACAGRPELPIIERQTDAAAALTAGRIDALLPADLLLIGEQHDAADHQRIEQQAVAYLAARGLLAAVALEMADSGASTAALKPGASEEQAQKALNWNDKGWPWKAYGPAVMTAVRAGVPVLGANLPRAAMKDSMADAALDAQLPGAALKAQQQLIRSGHCGLLPEGQIGPMTRIQIAKDVTMAHIMVQAALPGKVVLLLAGSGHTDRELGVPQHLPSDLKAKAVRLRTANSPDAGRSGAFDAVWPTAGIADKDYCEGLRKQFPPAAKP